MAENNEQDRIQEKVMAQAEYCKTNNIPNFALDGKCYHCGKNVFSDKGYSLKQASSDIITGCPFCHYSFCD